MRIENRRRPLASLAGIVGLAFASAAHGQAGATADPAPGWNALFRDVRFTLGPVRWKGDVSAEFRSQSYADQPGQRGFVESGNVAMSSYIHQPWFAQVSATLGFVATQVAGSGEGRSAALTGGAHVTVFPLSRFPFEATLNVTDSRANGESLGADFRNVLVGVRQSYRFANDAQVNARLDHSQVSGAALGDDVLDVAAVNFSARRDEHNVAADGFLSRNTGGSRGFETNIRRLNAQHGYVPSDNLTIDTMATYDWQETRPRNGGGALAGRFAQLASYGTWRPAEDGPLYDERHPLMVTGGLRLAAVGFETGSSSADAIGASGSAGLTYLLAPFTSLNASGSLSRLTGERAGSGLSSTLAANVSYDPPPLRWSQYAYSWRLSGGANAATGGELDRSSLTAQVNHQVSREFAPFGRSLLTLTFGQGLGATATTTHEDGVSISNSLQATWRLPGESNGQVYFGLGLADSRSYGTPETGFQLVNLQLTSQAPVNALSFVAANLTLQGTRQRGEPSRTTTTTSYDTGFTVSTYGSVSYQHRRAFGVPRLRFIASYTGNQSRVQTRAEGDITAEPRQTGNALDARLEYRIGKLDARLLLRSAAIEGRRGTGLYFRVTRTF
jgi:hypothetical protein